MFQRNPASPKRLQFLLKQLPLLLKKHQKTQYLADFIDDLPNVVATDPTRSGEYSLWILTLVVKGLIIFPEDQEKVREILTYYDKLKPRLPLEHRNIWAFRNYSDLRKVVLTALPELKSATDLQREGTKLIAEQVLRGTTYEIYELTTPEATSRAAKNTGWCVCNLETAQKFLKEGNLFLVLADGERVALAHQPSHQVMDVDDNPISPSKDNMGVEEEIEELFKLYLPQFICKKHQALENIKCNDCNRYECNLSDFRKCQKCDDQYTYYCPNHYVRCRTCSGIFCGTHSSKCNAGDCETYFCDEHEVKCDICNKIACYDCNFVPNCPHSALCQNCAATCRSCSDVFCRNCEIQQCNNCQIPVCSGCQEKQGYKCNGCKRYLCKRCAPNFLKKIPCAKCDQEFCSDCIEKCDKCKTKTCRTCYEPMSCDECLRDYCDSGKCNPADCQQCGEHTHLHTGCASCDVETLCVGCSIFDCETCGKPVCDNCQRKCSTCHIEHTYCKICFKKPLKKCIETNQET